MKYFVNGFSYDSYDEMINCLRCHYGTVVSIWSGGSHSISLKEFCQKYSHSDNDGIYIKGRNVTRYRYENRWNEETRRWEPITIPYYVWLDPVFEPNELRVTDELGRILNAKDLWFDIRNTKPFVVKKKNLYHWRPANYVPGAGGQGWCGGWQKHRGNHCGITPYKREWYAAQIESSETLLEYGATFKCSKRIEYSHPRYRGRSWKRSRVKKQWMRKLMYN